MTIASALREAGEEDAVDGVRPRWIAEPETVEEAAAILSHAHERGLAVAPRGSGTKGTLGNRPTRLDIVLSTARMNRVLEHAAGDLVVRLQSGASLQSVQRTLAPARQWLALDPPDGGTVGGIVATASSGSRRLRYGGPRDLLIGVTYILPDGSIARAGGKVVKNVAGYDLCKLFTGSLGTLALLVETIFRLHPVPDVSSTVVLERSGEPIETFATAIDRVLRSTLVPSAMDVVADGTEPVLAIRFEGTTGGVTGQVESARKMLDGMGHLAVITDPEEETALWERRVPASYGQLPGTTGLKISVPPADILRFMGSGARNSLSVHAHASAGIVHLRLGGTVEEQRTSIERIRDRAKAVGGSAVIVDAPVEVKDGLDVWGVSGPSLQLMERVKNSFDPQRMLNPGRFVGSL